MGHTQSLAWKDGRSSNERTEPLRDGAGRRLRVDVQRISVGVLQLGGGNSAARGLCRRRFRSTLLAGRRWLCRGAHLRYWSRLLCRTGTQRRRTGASTVRLVHGKGLSTQTDCGQSLLKQTTLLAAATVSMAWQCNGSVQQNTRHSLWSPYVIRQTIIFSSCFFLLLLSFFSSPNLSGQRLDVYHTLAHGVALVRI